MSRDDDGLIILGGLGLLALYLLGQKGGSSTTIIQQAPGQQQQGTPGCDSCGSQQPPASPQPAPVFCQGGQILRAGVCINPASDTPRLGSANNDAVLAEILRQLEASNAAGTWDLSWQIAAKRDAWIKSQGY